MRCLNLIVFPVHVYKFSVGIQEKRFKRFTLVSIRGSCLSNAVNIGKSFTLPVTAKKSAKIGSMVK